MSEPRTVKRKTGDGVSNLISALLAVVLAGLVCFISTQRYLRMDWTGRRRFSLHSRTRRMLDDLETPTSITIIYQEPESNAMNMDPRAQMLRWSYRQSKQMLEEFEARSSNVSLRTIDLSEAEEITELASRYDLPDRCVLFESEDAHEIIPLGQIVDSSARGGGKLSFTGEAAFAGALQKITFGRRRTVYFVTGHGERPLSGADEEEAESVLQSEDYSLSRLTDRLEVDNFSVKTLNLTEEGAVPADCDVLVLAGPRDALQDEELQAIRAYLREEEGRLLVMLDSGLRDRRWTGSGLNELLDSYGIRAHTDALGVSRRERTTTTAKGPDTTEQTGTQIPVSGNGMASHPVTRDLGNYNLIFLQSAPLQILDENPHEGLRVSELLTTNDSVWGETTAHKNVQEASYDPDEDLAAPITLGAVCQPASESTTEKPRDSRIVVFGSSLSFVNQAVRQREANLYLAMNAVNWLAGDEQSVGIPPKTVDVNMVSLSDREKSLAKWLFILVLPAGVVIAGVAVWRVRRR